MKAGSIVVAAAICLAAPGCVPYTVASTAATAPAGEWQSTSVTYFIPGGLEQQDWDSSRTSITMAGWDQEFRFGINEISDVGVRLPGMIGIILNYKRRFGTVTRGGPNWAWMIGAGGINAFEHAHFEASLLVSGNESSDFTPYGGLRAMQVAPLSSDAVRDSPSLGLFLGLRIGSAEGGISPELGVFYDRSALDLRSRRVIFVPGVSIHGSGIIRNIFGGR